MFNRPISLLSNFFLTFVVLFSSTSLFAAAQLGDPIYSPSSVDERAGIYDGGGVTQADLRNGNITLDTIPGLIVAVIETFLLLVGTICVVAIIYHAVRMQLASGILGDSSGVDKAKKGIYSAMMGFLLSMSAWFIMTKLVAIFGAIS